MSALVASLVVVGATVSFGVSASAGLGGSLLLVPTLALILGAREGIALAALMLGANNVVKIIAYRRSLPLRQSAVVIAGIAIGAFFGAQLLTSLTQQVVSIVVLLSFAVALAVERFDHIDSLPWLGVPLLSFASGASSGFSGTSGPLKGVAVRRLGLQRQYTVGAASLASLAGDATKTAVFARSDLLGKQSLVVVGLSLPIMLLATLTGRRVNAQVGEKGYAFLFWAVMAGYSIRLLLRF